MVTNDVGTKKVVSVTRGGPIRAPKLKQLIQSIAIHVLPWKYICSRIFEDMFPCYSQ